jgi:S-DNA-T family DNA segregation ATPase FtsK/SpoIIIE
MPIDIARILARTHTIRRFNEEVVENFPDEPMSLGKEFNLKVLPDVDILDTPEAIVPVPYNLDKLVGVFRKFKTPVDVVETHIGPTITTTFLKPRDFVRLNTLLRAEDEVALYLEVPSVRMRLVKKDGLIAIETPNQIIAPVRMRYMMTEPPTHTLDFPAGTTPDGEPVWVDLQDCPHLLVAGTTGSGKSVFLHSIILSLIVNNVPDNVRLVLIDPKGGVEFGIYEKLPHLFHYAYNAEDAATALYIIEEEMNDRYIKLKTAGVQSIDNYDRERLPFIVVVIDELASLFDEDRDLGEVQNRIITLAQKGRAAGIHLVLATQRPSHDVVTGRIKANFPARVGFLTATGIDSRVILDHTGAEKLLGNGDALFNIPGYPEQRVQAVLVKNNESKRIADWWRNQHE